MSVRLKCLTDIFVFAPSVFFVIQKEKFFRLLNFVRQLIKLTKPLEKDFEQHISQPKIQNVMQADKEFLTNYPVFFGKAVAELQQEAHEQGLEQGLELAEERVEREREKIIMNAYHTMGFSAEQVAKFAGFHEQYVQSVIDKFEKKV